ncbi:DUF3618 domain-containing protein [Janibacter hoylei PVAS-1]|uniref:DUF3618 domain-containing protein n=1 Tax=Janibacter hoylei PVAS-1 TaxID=1210046 RepID=A0A444B737_9MICO|nr:DUF3618 domain-containing protein [Janibacter hoylei PVAS-1]
MCNVMSPRSRKRAAVSTNESNEPVTSASTPTESDSTDPAKIEADIARHREDLGITVNELTDRLDVKKRAKRQVNDLKGQGLNRVQDLKRGAQQPQNIELAVLAAQMLALVAGVAAVAGAIWWWRR